MSHNEKAYVFPSSCAVGDGDDTIYLNVVGDTIDLGSPLNPIENGRLLIIPGAAQGMPQLATGGVHNGQKGGDAEPR